MFVFRRWACILAGSHKYFYNLLKYLWLIVTLRIRSHSCYLPDMVCLIYILPDMVCLIYILRVML